MNIADSPAFLSRLENTKAECREMMHAGMDATLDRMFTFICDEIVKAISATSQLAPSSNSNLTSSAPVSDASIKLEDAEEEYELPDDYECECDDCMNQCGHQQDGTDSMARSSNHQEVNGELESNCMVPEARPNLPIVDDQSKKQIIINDLQKKDRPPVIKAEVSDDGEDVIFLEAEQVTLQPTSKPSTSSVIAPKVTPKVVPEIVPQSSQKTLVLVGLKRKPSDYQPVVKHSAKILISNPPLNPNPNVPTSSNSNTSARIVPMPFVPQHRMTNREAAARYKTIYVMCYENQCDARFNTVEELLGHLCADHNIRARRCVFTGCDASYHSCKDLGKHYQDKHRDVTEWRCSKCPAKPKGDQHQLVKHIYMFHQEGRFECKSEGCNFVSCFRQPVVNHYRTTHY